MGEVASALPALLRILPRWRTEEECNEEAAEVTDRPASPCSYSVHEHSPVAQRAGSAAARSAGRWIQKFDGKSVSRLPVAGPASAVSHCDDFDFVIAQPIYQAERKSGEDVPSSAASMAGPCAWIAGNSFDRVP